MTGKETTQFGYKPNNTSLIEKTEEKKNQFCLPSSSCTVFVDENALQLTEPIIIDVFFK